MHNIEYVKVMLSLGLSTHQNGLKRRIAKYPHVFKKKDDGKWYITKEYSLFLTHCAANTKMAQQIKGGNHEQ
jgi:ketosteroid isomerase-like protein